ncbi:MAG: hypothetical protein Q9165_001022 [Trypethelium subeluteriae]
MKVVITGCTGFIGREVLEQTLQNDSITSVLVLSRRELSLTPQSPKLKVAILDDFLKYSDALLDDLEGAEAVLWCLGKAWMPDSDMARKVSVDYTLAAVRAFDRANATANNDKKLRFVYLSGAASERDQTKPLWFLQDYRRIRGQVENELIAHAKKHPDKFEAYIMRPGFVLAKETNLLDMLKRLAPWLKVNVLASAMIKSALEGNEHQIMENGMISSA